MPTRVLSQGHTLLVEGPCNLKVIGGNVECLGGKIQLGKQITISSPRQAPFLAVETALIDVEPKAGGAFREIEGSTIPTSWIEASQIAQQSSTLTVIVGNVDSGKSTLSTFLANQLSKQDLTVTVVDADIGQADIGPPATVSSARVQAPILGLHDLEPERSYFIGDTSPSIVQAKLIKNVVRLRDRTLGYTDKILINTDGWVADELAVHYKLDLLGQIRPDLVLGLSDSNELDPLLERAKVTSLRIDRSRYAKARTKGDRKKAREEGYKRFMSDSKILKVEMDRVKVRTFENPLQTVFVNTGGFGGFLTGLLHENDELIAIGRLREVRKRQVSVETRIRVPPAILEVGGVQLSAAYEEVGYGLLH
ncbi:MAG TPA: Clp1/GlmU family protein [Candidatus Bathyarchaeia archaeon]|nr:Clp1/GlmU family protein [Candidatus Bathyarchaeia archaeon]